MKHYTYTQNIDLDHLLKRDVDTNSEIREQVLDIIDNVKLKGDDALYAYTSRFDGVNLGCMKVTENEFEIAMSRVSKELITIIEEAARNIRSFHEKQLEKTWHYNPSPGIMLGQKISPIQRVGLYVPGGKAAYPSTVLMDSIPALVAGVKHLTMVTPPGKDGKINPAILVAAKIAGIHTVYKVGGAQAIAALAYGTQTIEPVHKIVGPGNIYVATAKKEVFGKVAIDMIAGPSEVLILSDGSGNPADAAGDLLSQAEHDEMAMPILVTTDKAFGDAVCKEVYRQIEEDISRKDIAKKSIDDYGIIFHCANLEDAFALSNAIAPEHLELMLDNADSYIDKVENAGAIFIGHFTPEPLGDYFAGPNHTLPTSGTAKFSSPLGVYDFLKRSSLISYDKAALETVHKKIGIFARSEGLDAHALSVERRFSTHE